MSFAGYKITEIKEIIDFNLVNEYLKNEWILLDTYTTNRDDGYQTLHYSLGKLLTEEDVIEGL